MEYPTLVVLLALLQYIWFSVRVGFFRDKYDIAAPACAGNEHWERMFRVQQNTLEQLIVFVPALYAFAYFTSPRWAAGLGAVFIIGRFLYSAEYIKDPKSRSIGFALTFLPNAALLIGAIIGVVLKLL